MYFNAAGQEIEDRDGSAQPLRQYVWSPLGGSFLAERRWWVHGCSCFEKLLKKSKLKVNQAATPTLDRLYPGPSLEPSPSG